MKKFIILICSLILVIITASAVMVAQHYCATCGQPLPENNSGKKKTGKNVPRWKEDSKVEVSGPIKSKTLSLRNFDKVSVSSIFNAKIKVGGKYSVKVTYPQSIGDFIVTDVKDGRLTVSIMSNVGLSFNGDGHVSPTVEITMPKLREIECSGVAKCDISGKIAGSELEVEASGQSIVRFADNIACTEVDVEISGISSLTCRSLRADELKLEANGVSTFFASSIDADRLDMEISGKSRLKVDGRTACYKVKADVSGMSEVYCQSFMAEKGSINVSGMSKFNAEEGNANGVSIMSESSSIKLGDMQIYDGKIH